MEIQIERTSGEPERPIPISAVPRPTVISSAEASLSFQQNAISWRGVFAGVAASFLFFVCLMTLGVALGGSTLRAIIDGSTPLSSLGASSAFWFVLSTLLSLYAGSYVGGRLSGPVSLPIGQLQGIVISALFFALVVSQLNSMMTTLGRGLTGAIGSFGQTVGEVGKNPMVQDAIRSSLGKIPLKSSPDIVMSEVASRMFRGDRLGARDYLAQQTGLSAREADLKIYQILSATQTTLKAIGNTTAQAITLAGWTLFTSFALGTLFSFLGGGLGAASHLGQTKTRREPKSQRREVA